MRLYAGPVERRSEGTLIILLVVVGVLTGLLTAGAVALYSANDEQDDAIAELKRETESLRSTNEALFARLATATEAEQSAGEELGGLRDQLRAARAALRRVEAQLVAARREARAQARAARQAREAARTATTTVGAERAARSTIVSRTTNASSGGRATIAAPVLVTPPPAALPPPLSPAPVARPGDELTHGSGGRGRGWGRPS